MFKVVKATRRNTRRSTSPPHHIVGEIASTDTVAVQTQAIVPMAPMSAMSFFDAESASAYLRPWLRLERGLRLQRFRLFAEEYPGLSAEEKDSLNKTLVKANDARLLNTKQQIVYENGKILSVRGLKMVRVGDAPATFKIEPVRPTKKKEKTTKEDSTATTTSAYVIDSD